MALTAMRLPRVHEVAGTIGTTTGTWIAAGIERESGAESTIVSVRWTGLQQHSPRGAEILGGVTLVVCVTGRGNGRREVMTMTAAGRGGEEGGGGGGGGAGRELGEGACGAT